ncbi:RDD family protein [Massilia sp. IC2-476]|uniref:RDD family protein n=1 Tax=Massilia sp. IC2-476 TaxID=2887199 RepID=UPI001D11B45E|nr:RDD family protein [Massilia sp. IC2-476]MCC2973757.1 RDD family protein [Massilia sp. IC2-476]
MQPIDQQMLVFCPAPRSAAQLPCLPDDEDVLPAFPLAGAWARWFARSFDLWWQTALVALAIGYLASRVSPSFLHWLETPLGWKLFGLACMPGGLVLDAAVLAVAGNTPGKALLGLRVITTDGSTPGFRELLRRNMAVWRAGLGLGLPAVSLLTMARQGLRLRKGVQASYDGKDFLVSASPRGWLAKGVFGLAFAGLFSTIVILDTVDRQDSREATAMLAAPPMAWTNPATGRSTMLAPQWKAEARQGADGAPQYLFTQHSGHAVVLFAYEAGAGRALRQNAQALEDRLADRFELAESYFAEFRGRRSWVGRGLHRKGPERVQLRIVEVDGKAWRVVAMQSPPAAYTDDLVAELSSALWDTVAPPAPGSGK